MNFKEFIKNEGLKKVALTRLKAASFSILIYLFNEIISGVEEIISSRKELSILLGWPEKQICEGLEELQFCNMIHIAEFVGKPLRIRANLDMAHWNIIQTQNSENPKKPTLGDTTNLHSLHTIKNSEHNQNMKLIDNNMFDTPILFPKNAAKSSKSTKKGKNRPAESTLNDLGAFREKHEIIDAKIKSLATNELETIKNEKRFLTSDEELLLQILSQHHQPRKQLILALKSNLIYPNLKFFLTTAKIYAGIPDSNKKQ